MTPYTSLDNGQIKAFFKAASPEVKQIIELDYDTDIRPFLIPRCDGEVICWQLVASSLDDAFDELYRLGEINDAQGIVFQVRLNPDFKVTASEFANLGKVFARADFEADILWGCLIDPSQTDNVIINLLTSRLY